MKKTIVILILIFVSGITFSYSKNYYFSNFGNDELNSGNSPTSAFKTISKLNSLPLNKGDSVFFKRGDAFSGQINISNSGTVDAAIHFGAYGDGINPIITGAIKITNWQKYSNRIFMADVSHVDHLISQLFVNNYKMTLARYPNEGFITIDKGNGNSNLYSEKLNQPSNYWKGATLVARMNRWVFETREVASSGNKSINLATPTEYNFKSGFGFFITNKFSELDAPGEWYHDIETKKIYFIPPYAEISPENIVVEASVYDYGFNINKQKFITIHNLTIERQALDGLYLFACSDILVKNNTFQNNFRNGIWDGFGTGFNIQIINNYFSDIGNNGINLSRSTGIINGNRLKKIALSQGLGGSGDGQYIGISSWCNTKIMNNTIDSIGYIGIHCHTGDSVVFNNVTNVCLSKDDGAGIYCYKSHTIFIDGNIIRNSIGNKKGAPMGNEAVAHCIYIDDSSSFCTITNNTVINGDYGFFLHNTFNSIVKNNVAYNNRRVQFSLSNDHHVLPSILIKENKISENIFYSLHPEQYCIYLFTYKNNISELGIFDMNYYMNPFSKTIAKSICVPSYPITGIKKTQVYEFLNWQELFKSDTRSKIYGAEIKAFYTIKTRSENFIQNSTFKNGKDGWSSWGSSDYTINLDSNQSLMNNKVLKSEFSNSTSNSFGNFYNGNFTLKEGTYYQLTFKAHALKNSNLDFSITRNKHPYTTMGESSKSFFIKKNVEYYDFIFHSRTNLSNARIYFSTTVYDSTQWTDEISLREVNVDINENYTDYPIFTNTTSSPKEIVSYGSLIDITGMVIPEVIILPAHRSMVFRRVNKK
jgi:parallel beta-helix repeat protein